MTTVRTHRGLRAALTSLLLVGLLGAGLPGASVSAQASDGDASVAAAHKYLNKVPGLKGQVQNLRVTSDPRGDAAEGGDAVWAAMGEVVLNKKLRNWFKKLVNGPIGWGELPAAGVPVWATFIGLANKPRLKGPATTVVHQGYGDGSRVASQGFRADPFELDTAIDSFGIWHRDDAGFFTQAASSLAAAAGVSWFGERFTGAGGVNKNVIANVVPIKNLPKGGNPPPGGGNPPPGGGGNPPPGGGGNPPPGGGNPPPGGGNPPPGGGDGGDPGTGDGGGDGGDPAELPLMDLAPSVHILVESTIAAKKDPGAVSQDHITWYQGTNHLRRDFALGDDREACFNTTSITLPDGTVLVEVTVQSSRPLDVDALQEHIKMRAFDHEDTFVNEVGGQWTDYGPAGYRGVFRIQVPATHLRSVRIAPDHRALAAVQAAGGGETDDLDVTVGRIASALATAGLAVPGTNGINECGKITSDDVHICDQRIVDTIVENVIGAAEAAAGEIEATAHRALDGSIQCAIAAAGDVKAVVRVTGVPNTEMSLDEAGEVTGCPVEDIDGSRLARVVRCDAFTVFLWLAEADLGEELEELAWQILVPGEPPPWVSPEPPAIPLPEPPENPNVVPGDPEAARPLGLDAGGIPIANSMMDVIDEVGRAATWRPAFPHPTDAA